jgi:hypothetical protein
VCLHALYHYRIPQALHVGEEASFEELAERCNLNVRDLRRLVRHAISNRIFKEARKGLIQHTAISKLMAEDPLFRDYIGVGTEEVWAASVQVSIVITGEEGLVDSNCRSDHSVYNCQPRLSRAQQNGTKLTISFYISF